MIDLIPYLDWGFPAVLCLYLIFVFQRKLDENTTAIKGLIEVIKKWQKK